MESSKNSMKRKVTSSVWDSFVKLEEGEEGEQGKRAQCILCHQILAYKSMKKHLSRKHQDSVFNGQEMTNGLTAEADNSLRNKLGVDEPKKKKKKRNSQELKKDKNQEKTAQNDTQKFEHKNIMETSSFVAEPDDQPRKLNTALLAVQRILEQLPKKIQLKAEVDMLDLVYSLHAKYCE